ncbi:MAG: hypothetical protein WD317_06120 [Balneolaceae bacterium]
MSAQQSDYEIQQEFRAEYSEIVNQIGNAVATSELEDIADRIDDLSSEYSDHTDILNAALYPETFSARIESLRAQFNAAQQKIATIEEMNDQIDELNAELEGFRGQLTDMDERTESLQRELQESQASERQISDVARQYRESLQERDRFVVEFLMELLNRYESVDASTEGELSDAAERLDDNPIDLLKTILGEYVNYVNQATDLNPPDYLSMRAQHSYFSEWWDGVGERMTQVFDTEAPVQSQQEVNDLLSNWYSAIDNRIWGALSDSFSENGIELDNFTNADAFYNSLEDYVSMATQTSRDQNTEEDVEIYDNFSTFWNETVKAQWGDELVAGDVLTHQQIAGIDQQLDEWNVAAEPTSNLMLILFLVSVAVIIGLVIALVRNRGTEA